MYKDERGWLFEVRQGLHIAGWTTALIQRRENGGHGRVFVGMRLKRKPRSFCGDLPGNAIGRRRCDYGSREMESILADDRR